MIRTITLFIFFASFSLQVRPAFCGTETFKAGRDQLQVVPNPGNGIFTIIYKSDTKGVVNLSVTDATGKYVYLKTVRDFGGELKETLDLSGLPKGIYIVEAERDETRETKKVIHQ